MKSTLAGYSDKALQERIKGLQDLLESPNGPTSMAKVAVEKNLYNLLREAEIRKMAESQEIRILEAIEDYWDDLQDLLAIQRALNNISNDISSIILQKNY